MGLLNPTISYNTGRIVDPFSGLNNAFGNTTQAITADEADKARKDALALQAERYAKADAQQALDNAWSDKAHAQQEATWKTANDKTAEDLVIKQRIASLDKNYSPTANDSIAGVEDYINSQTPEDIASGKAFGKVDGTDAEKALHAKFSAATNKAYDSAAPTQEQAFAEMAGKYRAAGASPAEAEALAKLKTMGYTSQVTQQAAAQKRADAVLAQDKWLYEQTAKQRGEEVTALGKAYSKSGSKGTGTGSFGGNTLDALVKAGIKGDEAEQLTSDMADFKAKEKYTDAQIAKAIPLAATDPAWLNPNDPEIQTKILRNIVRQNFGTKVVDANGKEGWVVDPAKSFSNGGNTSYDEALASINARYTGLQNKPSLKAPVSSAKTADQLKAEFMKAYKGDTSKVGNNPNGVNAHPATVKKQEEALKVEVDKSTQAKLEQQAAANTSAPITQEALAKVQAANKIKIAEDEIKATANYKQQQVASAAKKLESKKFRNATGEYVDPNLKDFNWRDILSGFQTPDFIRGVNKDGKESRSKIAEQFTTPYKVDAIVNQKQPYSQTINNIMAELKVGKAEAIKLFRDANSTISR